MYLTRHREMVGMVEEIKQTPIEKSEYQQALDNDVLNETAAGDRALRPPSTVRYWSDYNRVYYSPRTMQAVRPNTPDRDVTWSRGLELFKGFERETRLIEDSLRHFVEECDLLQGFQATFDNTSFGAFTMGLLEHIKDEYSKSPILTFPLLSSAIPSAKSDYSNTREAISIIGDSLVFRDLITSYASLVVPVQQPMNWDEDILKPFLKFNLSNIYQTSAILSAHFETSTLMLRTSFPEYPLPSSYPSILKQAPSVKNTTSVLSSLVVTSQIYSQISSYAYYVSAFLKRGDAGNSAWEDIGKDGLKDLAEELVRIAESYSSDDQSNEDRDEDEDYELDI
ncbi:mtDNA inheritance, partitioning of the mitochondrial organelle [Tulasnella sp. 403]|nr:mtDNA inheritance, partitioning of the mitochondrial organelle [Tulasnella sp. 403]